MNRAVKSKLAFLVSLFVKHSKDGVRSVANRMAMQHFDKLNSSPDDHVLHVGYSDEAVILATRVGSVVVLSSGYSRCVNMNRAVKSKLAFLVSLFVKHSKDGVRSVANRMAMQHFDKLNSSPDDHVLHVGYSDEAVILATRVGSVVVTDIDPDLLEIGKRDRPADNVEYVQDSLGEGSPHLADWGESFSQVVASVRITFFPNLPLVLRNMAACLKPGGQFLCIMSNNDYNFFGGAAKVIEAHPEWGQRVKMSNVTMWNHTEEQTEEFFRGICEWSQLSCKAQLVSLILSERKAKLIWLDVLYQVTDEGPTTSHRDKCLETLWQWAQEEYECTEDGCLKKPAEFMVIYGVKKN